MQERSLPILRTTEEQELLGTMAVYNSQAEASERIPHQWRVFRASHPELGSSAIFYGASPCTDDGKLHYLTGILSTGTHAPEANADRLTLKAGEYAVTRVDDPTQLRQTWIWLLKMWLPASGRRERKAPEFEVFTALAEDGTTAGPIELWIPLEPTEQIP